MIVYRLSKSAYAEDLSGHGAELSGGRWNSKGVALIYTSASRALCTTEIAVHTPLGLLPEDYKLISIEIPDKVKILEIKITDLSKDWKSIPYKSSSQQPGNNFVKEEKYPVLKVPSAVVQDEFNYLINPKHKDINKIKIIKVEDFNFDERLFKYKI